MKHTRIKFVCTGMCGEDHPVYDHCKECSHANFVTTVTTDSGKKIKLWFNMMFGPSFEGFNKAVERTGSFNPGQRNPIWKVVDDVSAFADRNCAKWREHK